MSNFPQSAPGVPGFDPAVPMSANEESLHTCLVAAGFKNSEASKAARAIHRAGWGGKLPPPPSLPVSARESAAQAVHQLRRMMDADRALCLLDAAGKDLPYFKLVRRETVNVAELNP